MDAGVAAGLLQVAATPTLSTVHVFPSRVAASKRPAAPRGCGGAGPSAASALLSDAPRHRPRRASLHPAPRRSQRRLTPFFSSLLVFSQRDELLQAILAEVQAEPDQDPEHDVEVNRIPHAPAGADR